MNTVYLDNAATTPVDPQVIEVMQKSMHTNFGNPSSTHQFGRRAKNIVENARKNIADVARSLSRVKRNIAGQSCYSNFGLNPERKNMVLQLCR